MYASDLQIEDLRDLWNSDPLAYKGKGLSNIFVSHPLRVPESLINYHLFRAASWCVASSVLI